MKSNEELWREVRRVQAKVEKEMAEERTRNNWHTGIPTEEGDYLCWVKGSFGIKHGLYYNRCKYKDGNWFDDEVTNYNLKNMRFQVIAWQKIEPYKEKEDAESSFYS